MTKRFIVPKMYRCIQDNLTKEHYLCEDKTEAINLAYLLNELHEENESLKEEIKFLRNKVATYKKGNALLKSTMDKEWK